MNKVRLIAALLILFGLLCAGLTLGSLSTNYFAAAGLLLSLLSVAITISVASSNALKARRTIINGIEPYEPMSAKRMKMLSKTHPRSDPIINLQNQLAELRSDHETLADYVDTRVTFVLGYAHERLTRHEEVELPQILGAQSGVIIAGAVLSLIGTVVVFAPDPVYSAFSGIVSVSESLVAGMVVLWQ